jgi:glucose-1-phosphate adenylyltransferase
MVSEGCILNGVYARRSIIGLRSRIDNGVKLENSILMGSDFFESFDELNENINSDVPHIGIGANSVIKNAIIDKNVRIGSNVQLVNKNNVETKDGENGSYFIREGIIIVPKDAIIKNNMVI